MCRAYAQLSKFTFGGVFENALCKNPGTEAGIDGQILVLFVMVVAAAEVAIGLSIMILFYRKHYSVDVQSLNRLKH